MPRPTAYILCTSPRSGSTLLCALLRDSGVAGHPKSYFHRPSLPEWRTGLGLEPDAARTDIFADATRKGRGNTTIFGLRLQRHSAPFFFDQLRDMHPDAATDAAAVDAVRADIQMIFQDPFASLNPRWRVRDIIAEPIHFHGLASSKAEAQKIVSDLLDVVGLGAQAAQKFPHEFSGGQRQRISIARALITDPEFIVADEPISALDVSIQAQVLNLLSKARAERGLTYFFITHDLSVVEHFGDRVAVMYLGEIVELAPVAEIFAAPQHPYTRLLLSAIPRIGGGAFKAERVPGEIPTAIDPPKGCAFASRCPLAQDRCRVETPVLKPTPTGTLAACHAVEGVAA